MALASVGFRPPMRPMRATDARPSAEAKGRSAVARSPTDWYRAAGFFSRHRRTTASKAAGTLGANRAERRRLVGDDLGAEARDGLGLERLHAGEQLVER